MRNVSAALPDQAETRTATPDTTAQMGEKLRNPLDEEWRLMHKLRKFDHQEVEAGFKRRELGVTWTQLTVRVPDSETAVKENFLSQFNLLHSVRRRCHRPPLRTVLHNSHGCVKPGEMLLVLGRPGSGCTTLLKMLANQRAGYSEVTGNVFFGAMKPDEADQYRGQIIMNTEEEIFFPTLTVGQTLDFATKAKVPSRLPGGFHSGKQYAAETKEFLLESLGISHTANTRIGNEHLRGVSGGERKRVSLLECLASRAAVFCWDNSTRGLDASNALDWARATRAMTDVHGLSTIVTLYQAGNDIYNLFDKVLVLDEGKQVYYGPREEARGFMEQMGFICDDGANVADFLTGVTVPGERSIRPGYETSFPRGADDVLRHYHDSKIYPRMTSEYDYPDCELSHIRTDSFRHSVSLERHSANSQHTVKFTSQVRACVVRQYQIIGGDLATFLMKQISTLIQALIAGSLYYNPGDNSTGLFLKGGALYWSLLYPSLTAMSEVVDSFTGRPVITKHKTFAYIHPAATCISQICADIPTVILQVTLWSLIVYFMVGLTTSASGFFTYWVVLFMTNMCSCALFRAIGAASGTFEGASKISGYAIACMAMYSGFLIPKSQMHPWFSWIFWLNPQAYGFESLMGNEFHDKTIGCDGVNLIPRGEGYDNIQQQACAGVGGAKRGATSLVGDDYIGSLSYQHAHLWRDFGIVCAFWVFFVAVTIVAIIHWRDVGATGDAMLIPRERLKQHHRTTRAAGDEESQSTKNISKPAGSDSENIQERPGGTDEQAMGGTALFTWKGLRYTVQTPSGPRVLLNNVQGWARPGTLTALMGSSGAGKTTLLDVLAQRKTEGTIQGEIMVDGRALGVSFQRRTGYCEQLDVHEPYATVREALEFSALLRQSRDTPRAEKLKYVDVIVDLLELHDIADTLIGKAGEKHSLSIEQRKRVTIAVELVAKPKTLLFLDEPTSGLSGQSAYKTVGFLRKLADAGQAVLVTVHQPSAQLFFQFDRLLLLAKGGNTVYFGDIGKNGSTVQQYFARHGAPCPTGANPAEHAIDVVSGLVSDTDWSSIWLQSPEYKKVTEDLDAMVAEASLRDAEYDDGYEFAMPLSGQIRVVLHRMNVALYRNTSYINNKILLHVGLALFNGFTYWKIGDTVRDTQLRTYTVFVWMFVASGVVNQLQPLFIERRNLYDSREKKARIYSWKALVTALILSEIPYLVLCGVLYFVCWYYTVGFSSDSRTAGPTFFVVLIYEFLYTGIGQLIAAYAPNAVFAALVNPLIVGTMVSFCGILVPYGQIVPFWRYWMYYLNPVTYLVGSVLTFVIHDVDVRCSEEELASFDPPANSTCAEYLDVYLNESGANLLNPDASSDCHVCPYTKGSDYLRTFNLDNYSDGWKNTGIVGLFIFSSYALVYLFMKLRTKASKKIE